MRCNQKGNILLFIRVVSLLSKVKAGSRKINKQYVRKYKKIFTKKNAGKKVTVK